MTRNLAFVRQRHDRAISDRLPVDKLPLQPLRPTSALGQFRSIGDVRDKSDKRRIADEFRDWPTCRFSPEAEVDRFVLHGARLAHAATMDGANGWRYTGGETENGAILTLTIPSDEMKKLSALGFFGVITVGMHHQEHHMMIARGSNPHH